MDYDDIIFKATGAWLTFLSQITFCLSEEDWHKFAASREQYMQLLEDRIRLLPSGSN